MAGRTTTPVTYAERPFPDWLERVRADLASLAGSTFNSCLLNLYAAGTSAMGWHFDSYELLVTDSPIVILSLGAERTLQFRSRADAAVRWETPMQHGHALVMSPPSRTRGCIGFHAPRTRSGFASA